MNFASDWANQILQDKPSSGCHCVCPPGATGGVSETVTTNTPSQPEAPVSRHRDSNYNPHHLHHHPHHRLRHQPAGHKDHGGYNGGAGGVCDE